MKAEKQSTKELNSTKLLPLEFRLFTKWREDLVQQNVLVACSGGRDSVALAHCLHRLSTKVGFKLSLAHVHHGFSFDDEITNARETARSFVERLGQTWDIPVFAPVEDSPREAERVSEESLRDYRLQVLSEIATKGRFTRVAFAHHADDLLETRLIRLIRGTGPRGITAMREKKDRVIRPLLAESSSEIGEYAKAAAFEWIDDPTNSESGPLRNWIRNEWLPQLEKKRTGASVAIARSLESLAVACERSLDEDLFTQMLDDDTLDRRALMNLQVPERRSVLSSYLARLGGVSFSSRHVDEILKRLNTSQKVFQFRAVGLTWNVNAERVAARTE